MRTIIHCNDGWTAYSGTLVLPAGEAPLYFVYEGDGGLDFASFEIE